MHTYIHACIHTYTHAYIHTHMHTYTHAYIHAPIHASTTIYIHTIIQTYRHMHTYIHTCIHTHMHTYIHTHMHTYMHTSIQTFLHIHTYIRTISRWNARVGDIRDGRGVVRIDRTAVLTRSVTRAEKDDRNATSLSFNSIHSTPPALLLTVPVLKS